MLPLFPVGNVDCLSLLHSCFLRNGRTQKAARGWHYIYTNRGSQAALPLSHVEKLRLACFTSRPNRHLLSLRINWLIFAECFEKTPSAVKWPGQEEVPHGYQEEKWPVGARVCRLHSKFHVGSCAFLFISLVSEMD